MQIAHALRYLYPDADPRRDYRVEDDGTGAKITYWGLPDPQPTLAQLQAASDAYDAQQASDASDAAALRTRILNIAQSAVGIPFDQLTAVQVRSLLAVLLWKGGALNADGTVRPLGKWT